MRAHKRRIEELRREALNALPALLSIARRAADVEGMADVLPDFWTRETGFATAKENATAVSRYVMGETTPVSIADIGDDEEVGR